MLNTLPLYLEKIQSILPGFFQTVEKCTKKHLEIMYALDEIRVEDFLPYDGKSYGKGRPQCDRIPIIRAFIAKSILNISQTKALIERLNADPTLQRICGWRYGRPMPCESTFSNVFKEISESKIIEKIHENLIMHKCEYTIIDNISRDASQIDAREKPYKSDKNQNSEATSEKPELPTIQNNPTIFEDKEELTTKAVTHNVKSDAKQSTDKTPKKRGRPKKGEVREPKEPSRLEQQQNQSFEEMIANLPTVCNKGCKKNSKGYKVTWNGFKLHADITNRGLAISCILTSASVHDSQVSLPLETLTNARVQSKTTLADAAYDSKIIKENIESHGKSHIIDHNPRRGEKALKTSEEKEEYKDRSYVERFFGDLKDNFAGRFIMVKGHAKVMCHLMLGVLAHTALKTV